MKLTNIKSAGYDNQHLSVLLRDFHGEHSLPEFPGVNIRRVWDWGKSLDIVTSLKSYLSIPIEEANRVAYKNTLQDYTSGFNGAVLAFEPDEDSCEADVLWVTFWAGPTEDNLKELITEYMLALAESVTSVINNASGDDDFYDYMPTYVGLFQQLAEFFGEEQIELYNNTIRPFLEMDSSYEEAIGGLLMPT